jgi:outer membrane protein OmpA-like peptidoglycan-associated protein
MADTASTPRGEVGPGDTLIVVMGPRWLALTKGHADRAERDEVRAVIASALNRRIAVVPVRVGKADTLPPPLRAEQLPEDIRPLALLPSRMLSPDRLPMETLALAYGVLPNAILGPREKLPGNSMFKMLLWAAGVVASTVLFVNLLAYLTGSRQPVYTEPGGLARPASGFPAWTGEGRIRRAIEAALAKGRRPEEARRCQTSLINATDSGIILFDTASAELDQRSHQTLDALARIIKDCPDFVIEVEGHTDNMGEPANNQRLSERRAFAVRDYLVRTGVRPEALSAVGYGATRPIAANDTPAGMARNRRIEFNVTAR